MHTVNFVSWTPGEKGDKMSKKAYVCGCACVCMISQLHVFILVEKLFQS